MSSHKFTNDELNLIRQWFDAIQDLNPAYLKAADYELAKTIYTVLGMRIPNSIIKNPHKKTEGKCIAEIKLNPN